MKEQEQYLGLLRQLKDYDEMLTQELAAKAYQEQEKQRLEVQFASLLLAGTVDGWLYICISEDESIFYLFMPAIIAIDS